MATQRGKSRLVRLAMAGLLFPGLVAACATAQAPSRVTARSHVDRDKKAPPATGVPPSAIHKIKHVIIIMQENRSFDSYFGTYPGADGIPLRHVCVPNPRGKCIRPFHDTADINGADRTA